MSMIESPVPFELLSKINERRVLEFGQWNGPASRAVITRGNGRNAPTVSKSVCLFDSKLIFHPHLLAADGLFTPDGRFHCMPAEDLAPAIQLFRHRSLQALRDAKLISPSKLANLLAWKHSGFNIHHGGEQPVPATK